jgi:hypothetical protein
VLIVSELLTVKEAVAHPKGGSGALYRGQEENKKKGGVTVFYFQKYI